ncbi:MAG TPA: ATP-grasp domain-containing protein [Pirellulales bacterium]|nr:ATP-grasp domain-containing protein [Pirellulales bacterium]
MATIFVYEHLTGGGLLNAASPWAAPASLLPEGKAMAAALIADFAALPSVDVVALRDRRLAPWKPAARRLVDVADSVEQAAAFDRWAAEADWTVLIAPETAGALADRCRRAAAVGGRLLGPSPALVELAGDKHSTAEFLAARGVATPAGRLFHAGQPWPADISYPAIWKPRDGAGSQGIVYLETPDEPRLDPLRGPGRLERFCPGLPASVAVLCGPGGLRLALPPCSQRLSDDRRFTYLGGALPLAAELAIRARALAERAASALPGALGYLGIDLTLGAAPDGAGDVVIEVNPRLTTSYIGLRAACRANLAEAMLHIAEGRLPRAPLEASRAAVFDAAGRVRLKTKRKGLRA